VSNLRRLRRPDPFDAEEIELPSGAIGSQRVGGQPRRTRGRLEAGFITLPAEWKRRLTGQPTHLWALALCIMSAKPQPGTSTVILTNAKLAQFGIWRRWKMQWLIELEGLGLVTDTFIEGGRGKSATRTTRLLVG
jgi:hypothetical protein